MSVYMDDVDREFISSLFPEYLLLQPVAYYLWKTYFQHRKLFHKLKHCKNSGINKGLVSSDPATGRLPNKLSFALKKEIWQKLMNLGVLGTLSFDSANDEYLVQAHKYFYPGISEKSSIFGNSTGNGVSDKHRTKSDEAYDVTKSDFNGGNSILRLNSSISNDVNEMEQVNNSDLENEEVSSDNSEGNNDGEGDEDIAVDDDDSSHSSRDSSAHASNIESMSFYPALSSHKYPPQSRNNQANPDIYNMLDYNLPSQWVTQSSNSVLLSADGISQLRPNPNWQAYMAYERSNYSTRNRLRNSFSGNQKNNFAITWANHPLHSNKLGLFYYEIRVLSVTSSQGAQNSNIIVGYKYWPDSDPEATPQRGENEPSSTASQTPGIGEGLRTSLRGSSSASEAIGGAAEASATSKMGIDEGFFGYYGSDGSITASSQSKSYSKPFGRDDVIGCGVNFVDGTIFFTKNGICLGTAFTDFYDFNLVPYIALKPGNSVRTNFGLYEEFVFDIVGYQERWKAKSYKHIFKSIDTDDVSNEFESDEEDKEDSKSADHMDVDDEDAIGSDANEFREDLIMRDSRYEKDHLYKPNVEKLNTLNTADDSIPSTLHTMINDYLIHEGLIDVAKGFLKDLKKSAVQESEGSSNNSVMRHNERQIIKEEKNLNLRQELRRYIASGNISQCLSYIESHVPGLLHENMELLFELKLAQYLLTILNHKEFPIEKIVAKGQELSKEFVYDENLPQDSREKFRNQLSNVSALLAYDDPKNESPEELAAYLSSDYLQDRLFQTVNTSVLTFLKKNSDCELENVIRYTRAMLSTLMNYEAEGSVVFNATELRYFKILNMDEDLLNI